MAAIIQTKSSKALMGKRRPSQLRRILKRILIGILALVVGGLLTLLWAFGIEPNILTVTRLTIVDDQLPQNWDGRVIAFFTDIHVGESFDAKQLDKVASAINKAKPDLLLFGGDLVDHRTPTDQAFADSISAIFDKMAAPLGKYAIVGNHDNRLQAELEIAVSMLEKGGFKMLVNQSVNLDGILLGGLDESYFGQPSLSKTFPAEDGNSTAASSKGAWRLLLMHQPDFAAALPANSARLILSGHAHNGQITFFGQPINTVYQGRQYTYGRYKLDDKRQLVVSRGLGTIGLRARFWAPPEIMLITVRQH